jgi:hypothetical protein
LQLDIRYSRNKALDETGGVWLLSDQRICTDWTMWLNCHFNPRDLTLDYTLRDVNAPKAVVPTAAITAAINNSAAQTSNYGIMTRSVDNRLDVRLTHAF